MKLTKIALTGAEYLAAVTELLQNIRLENSSSGLYEAADLQWWWREDDAAYQERQIFWRDQNGIRVACLLQFDAGDDWNYDFFFLPSADGIVREEVFPEIISAISWPKASTITVREDDLAFRHKVEKLGFAASPVAIVQAELVGDCQKVELKAGFVLHFRQQNDSRPHHLIQRNGPNIARKLKECSLYRTDLDFAIRDSKDELAAYGLFWMDPVTKVGLIEPLRTETSFQRLGLAKFLIAEGTRQLRALGANIIRVSYKADNTVAAQLYHQCGFQDRFVRLEYRRSSV